MKTHINFSIVIMFLSIHSLLSQGIGPIQLDVEGDTRVQGFFDLSTDIDELSLTIGTDSGYNLTGTRACTFIGVEAGEDHTTGNECIFIGYRAGASNLSGDANSFVGNYAGTTNTQGDRNSFFGNRAGAFNVDGDGNSFFGYWSGRGSTGNFNTAMGTYSLSDSATGNANTVIGYSAGSDVTSGANNVLVGAFTALEMTTGSRNTIIGYLSGYSSIDADRNTFIGYGSGRNATNAVSNVIIGHDAGLLDVDDDTDNDYNTLIGTDADFWYTNPPPMNPEVDKAIALGYKAMVGCNNCAVVGGTGVDAVNVGVGLNVPAHQLHLSTGDAAKPGGGDWINTSDRRLKKNIQSYEDGLDVIMQIDPVWYQYLDKYNLPSEEHFVGIIAQDMQKIAPYMVGETEYVSKDETGVYLNFDGSALKFMLINAVKEQEDKIRKHEQEIAELKGLVRQLLDGQSDDK